MNSGQNARWLILDDQLLPLPPPPPQTIKEGTSLKEAEAVIACSDVYLWLGYRPPFRHLVEDRDAIMRQRDELTREIDTALLRKFDPTAVAVANVKGINAATVRERHAFYDS